jgi:CubicO group peptidase (beta-lactamase class C family)
VGPQHHAHRSRRPFQVTGAGYGGLVGPVTDAARLAALHLSDGTLEGAHILSSASARAMRTITAPGPPFDMGLGWFRTTAEPHPDPAFVEHLGSGIGYRHLLRIYPGLDLGVAVLSNTTGRYDHDAICDAVLAVDWP